MTDVKRPSGVVDSTPANTCASCTYMERRLNDLTKGSCKRYPPTISFLPTPNGAVGTVCASPEVAANNYCGEFKLKSSGRFLRYGSE